MFHNVNKCILCRYIRPVFSGPVTYNHKKHGIGKLALVTQTAYSLILLMHLNKYVAKLQFRNPISFIALPHTYSVCGFHDSWWSMITPK